METKYGLRIVTADNLFKILGNQGIQPWPQIQPPMNLEDYLAGDLTERQLEEVRRFAPKNEVVFLRDSQGRPFTGFRHVGKNWATVFAPLDDDLVPIVCEFKHGAEVISIGLPSGVPGRQEVNLEDPIAESARREFLEETGIEIEQLIPLSGPEGIPISGRQSTQRYFPFLGRPKTPISPSERKPDKTEFLKAVLIPLKEWLKLIEEGKVTEVSAISTTFLALWQLGRLKVIQ